MHEDEELNMSESKRSALIAGAQGVIGRATAEHFSSPGHQGLWVVPTATGGDTECRADQCRSTLARRCGSRDRAFERCHPHRLRCVCREGHAGRTQCGQCIPSGESAGCCGEKFSWSSSCNSLPRRQSIWL